HTATPLPDGRVLLAGGGVDPTNSPTNTAEIFTVDPSLPLFGSIATTPLHMQQARYGHAAALLKNGSVLITGGLGSPGLSLSSSEVFCPSSSCGQDAFLQWNPPNPMGRAFHTAVALDSGDVLVAGGVNINPPASTYLDTAQLFVYTGTPASPGDFDHQAIPM